MKFYTRFDPPPKRGLTCGDSRTHAECAKDCDINYLLRRYQATGVLPNNGKVPLDGAIQDFVGSDFQSLQNRMIQAQEEFEALPSSVRDRFANDPANLIAFLGNKENREEAVKLGLIAAAPAAREAPGEQQAITEPAS